MRHVFYIEGDFDGISFEAVMNIADTVFKRFVFDVNDKGFWNQTSVLNLVQDPVRYDHSAIELSNGINYV